MSFTPLEGQQLIDNCARGRKRKTPTEIKLEKTEVKVEREMHEMFRQWCNLNQIAVIEAPMHRKSWLPNGWPDMTCMKGGKAVLIEFKMPGNRPTEDQLSCISVLTASNAMPVMITDSVAEAIFWTKAQLF